MDLRMKFRGVTTFEVQEYQVGLVANLGIALLCFAFFFQNLSEYL